MAKTVRFGEYGEPEVLVVEDVPVAEPGPGELLVRIEAIGLNRAEALYRRGLYIERPNAFPAKLGAEAAGTVESVGPGVTGFEAGQAVSVIPSFSMNDYAVYAERAVVPASAVLDRPEGIDAATGAAVWMPYLTAYGALVQVGGLKAGDPVVITAASSSVGLAAIQIANRLGAKPIATTRTTAKRDALLEAGAAAVVVTEDEPLAERVLELTGGKGARHAFDAVAGSAVANLVRATAPGGTVFLYGVLSGEATPFPNFALGMPAVALRTFLVHETTRSPERLREAEAFIVSGLRSGAFTPRIDRAFAFDDIAAAHAYLERGGQIGKIIATV
ncbi:zinc-dependent alcohol dehydrogenase family protein [Glycomyces paridis]|uniref:NADPH:quinone reductase n=1 Tax=Glycomyces paridis TaxID=2126555 RepID=A0A4S8P9Q7_9ACTN|nr:zinc-dependent alcohol dehydrogenase family protein [Glycomyces paridis]THV26431.1 NADPH:quinone reductase [Glycomyces paridis]